MTIYFGLSIETNNKKESENIADYFKTWAASYKYNSHLVCLTKDIENNYWVNIYSDFYTMTDIERENIANSLYDTLRQSNLNYRYALVGTEVDEFRTYTELIEELPSLNIPGLVISTKLTKRINKDIYKVFSEGYFWQPYMKVNV